MTKEGKVNINKFDGTYFGFRKMQIEDYLYQKKVHEPLKQEKTTSMDEKEWKAIG